MPASEIEYSAIAAKAWSPQKISSSSSCYSPYDGLRPYQAEGEAITSVPWINLCCIAVPYANISKSAISQTGPGSCSSASDERPEMAPPLPDESTRVTFAPNREPTRPRFSVTDWLWKWLKGRSTPQAKVQLVNVYVDGGEKVTRSAEVPVVVRQTQLPAGQGRSTHHSSNAGTGPAKTVTVRSYVKNNGTVVDSYHRSAPHRHR